MPVHYFKDTLVGMLANEGEMLIKLMSGLRIEEGGN